MHAAAIDWVPQVHLPRVHAIEPAHVGELADATALQKRTLNASKGPAVWALRAQTDKAAYARAARAVVEAAPGLDVREGMAVDVLVTPDGRGLAGIVTHFGVVYSCRAAVLTTGTFGNGVIWVGPRSLPAGR